MKRLCGRCKSSSPQVKAALIAAVASVLVAIIGGLCLIVTKATDNPRPKETENPHGNVVNVNGTNSGPIAIGNSNTQIINNNSIAPAAEQTLKQMADENHKVFVWMKSLHQEKNAELKEEFPLGYVILSAVNNKMLPFQAPSGSSLIIHWERTNYSSTADSTFLTLHLPDIVIFPNIMVFGDTIRIPNQVGAKVTLNIDPKAYKYGVAIQNNTFECSDLHEQLARTQSTNGTHLTPESAANVYLIGSTVNWVTNTPPTRPILTQGSFKVNLAGEWLFENVTVNVSDPSFFERVVMVRGTLFNNGPSNGYRFPKAPLIRGNVFNDALFDPSCIPDNSIISDNRFSSSNGTYSIGPHPEMSFVVEVFEIRDDIAIFVFGLKPYKKP